MANTVTALSTAISADNLWGVFNDAIPFIAVVVLVSLGFYFVRRLVKGVSKGKTKF